VADPPGRRNFHDNDFRRRLGISEIDRSHLAGAGHAQLRRRLRYALISSQPVNELRAEVTLGFPLKPIRPTSAELSGAMPVSRG
jgi:hypothetical protein